MNISVIIPIHEYNDQISLLLDKAVESVVKQEGVTGQPSIIVVYAKDLAPEMMKYQEGLQSKGIHSSFIANTGRTDYQTQVNFAVKAQLTTDYFTVLEFDDEYSTTFFKNAEKYVEAYPDVDVFLTMMIEVNEKNEGIKLTNEMVWAQQFVGENGEMGYLNANALKQYTDFKLSGAVIKKSEFENMGGYKSNIKLTFMYEFLLRLLSNACKIYSIPKIGYKHLAVREGSLFDTYLKTMPVEERKFWFDTATKEANILNDRAIDMSRLQKK